MSLVLWPLKAAPVPGSVGGRHSGERESNLMATASGDGKGTRRPVMPFVAYAVVLALVGAAAIALWTGRGSPPAGPASERAPPALSKAAPTEPADANRGLKVPPRPAEARGDRAQQAGACGIVGAVTERGKQSNTGGPGGGKARAAEDHLHGRCRPLARRQNGAGQGRPNSPARSRPL